MKVLAVALEVPLMLVAPVVCRVRGHRWHVWPFHAAIPLRICVRCGHSSKGSQ